MRDCHTNEGYSLSNLPTKRHYVSSGLYHMSCAAQGTRISEGFGQSTGFSWVKILAGQEYWNSAQAPRVKLAVCS